MRNKKYNLIIFIIVIGLIFILFRPDAIIKVLLTTKMQTEVPTEFRNKFAEKEINNHIVSLLHKDEYPESFYRVPGKYDFVVYAFDGISNNIQDLQYTRSNTSFESLINHVSVPVDFMQGVVHCFRKNLNVKVKQIRFNGNIISQKFINGSYVFRTEGEYEIFFNNSRVIYTNTDTGNYIIIKNEGEFYQICILEIYDKANEKQIISRFETY